MLEIGGLCHGTLDAMPVAESRAQILNILGSRNCLFRMGLRKIIFDVVVSDRAEISEILC
jgi:hypothetical protein